MALQPGVDVGSVPISDEMEEPCDSERDRRSEFRGGIIGCCLCRRNSHD